MIRAALYIRVSTEEQAQYGYSLDAQREALTTYANKHGMSIVDYYVDAGHSARKKYPARPEFMRMLRDVEAGKIDLILFIKLDRWFRSVKDYYKIQEILEANNVGWKTTEEHYDTTTTNGRLYINIRLSVAQDESDRTSDRINFVFKDKVARGEVISGSVPVGFKIKNKRLVHDEEKKGMIADLFEHYVSCQSKYASHRYIIDKYGVKLHRRSYDRLLRNPIYSGEYKGNREFCEPIISRELFEKVQRIQKGKNVKRAATGRVYIFSGLLRCAECGHACAGFYSRDYFYYRCINAIVEHRCHNHMTTNEKLIEEWLLANIANKIMEHTRKFEAAARKKSRLPKPSVDRAKIRRKLEKLKELFINDLITLDEYRRDYNELTSQLEVNRELETPSLDLSTIERFLGGDFEPAYEKLGKKERQALWRQIISEIRVDSSKNIDVVLL
jgi:DNA invertase Pin-like site-specific DNA recombinase